MSFFSPQNNSNPYLTDPDVRLMLKFKEGDKASFESLMEKYYSRILNFAYRFVGNKAIAEDLTQDVFIRVYKSSSSYNPRSKFATWLYTIAKNASLNELRKNRHRMVSLDETFKTKDGDLKRQIRDVDIVTTDHQMMRNETITAVKKAINSLPENQRIAVILRKYESFSYEEIAKTMNLSFKAVKSLLSRAKENLKLKLSDYVRS